MYIEQRSIYNEYTVYSVYSINYTLYSIYTLVIKVSTLWFQLLYNFTIYRNVCNYLFIILIHCFLKNLLINIIPIYIQNAHTHMLLLTYTHIPTQHTHTHTTYSYTHIFIFPPYDSFNCTMSHFSSSGCTMCSRHTVDMCSAHVYGMHCMYMC